MLATMVRARSRTLSSIRATTFGVNARLTIVRSRRWRGSSRLIIEPENSAISGGTSLRDEHVGMELKTSGWRLAWWMSSNLVSAQWPGPAGHPGKSATSKNVIGDSRRNVANAPSRRSSSRSQNSSDPRSMSPSGTSGGGTPFSRRAIPIRGVVDVMITPASIGVSHPRPAKMRNLTPASIGCPRAALDCLVTTERGRREHRPVQEGAAAARASSPHWTRAAAAPRRR